MPGCDVVSRYSFADCPLNVFVPKNSVRRTMPSASPPNPRSRKVTFHRAPGAAIASLKQAPESADAGAGAGLGADVGAGDGAGAGLGVGDGVGLGAGAGVVASSLPPQPVKLTATHNTVSAASWFNCFLFIVFTLFDLRAGLSEGWSSSLRCLS